MPHPPLPITALLLAAGQSRRMGQANKLLLPWQGQALVLHTLQQLLAANVAQVVVVLGHEAEAVSRILAPHHEQLHQVYNPQYATGMTSSIQCGWQAISPHAQGLMVCLSDMPWLQAADYRLLGTQFVQAYRQDPQAIVVPKYAGTRGNPVTFSRQYRPTWEQHPEPEGGKDIVKQYAKHVVPVSMPGSQIHQDLDTPTDWQQALGNAEKGR